MDDLRRKIFDYIWKEYSGQFSGYTNFLDTLYQEALVDKFEYEELRHKNGKDLLNSINAILIGSKKGYNIFLNELNANYKWLHAKAKEMESDEETKRGVHTTALITGGVPRPPQFYIERTQLLDELKKKLRNLQPKYSNKIVLYGMNGVGKSCMASAALRDVDLVLECFNNKVFWINVGKVDEEQLFEIMFRLYRKIVVFSKEFTDLPKDKPSNIEQMSDNLLMLFQTDNFKNTLIVLDSVFCKNVVKCFDVGCNLLIIAQEKISISKENIHFMSVQDGFSEEESFRVFANCLDTTYNEIKKLAEPSLIHNWCKGDPMLISLCATIIQERKLRLLKNEKEWKFLYDALSRKKTGITEKRFKTINMCYENLDSNLRLRYQDFAVFVYDINIRPEVLMVLWGLEKDDVEDVMQKLMKKCLVVSNYNDHLRSDVYGIHHVFLEYLKEKLIPEELTSLHKKLLNSYREVCQNDYAQLPNDNYIYQYIGYHLSAAKQYGEFSIYFDLNFIGAKIQATGIADLLRDYTTYKEFITDKKDVLEEKLMQYKSFVEMFGQNLHTYTYTDIIQSALQLPKDNPIYRTACKIAKEKCDEKLYFIMHAPHESNYYTHTLIVNDRFKAACFTEETNEILIGTESGTIEMWEPKYAHKLQTFERHNDAIVFLKLNETRDSFISISKDGIMKLWNLDGVKQYKRKSHGHIFSENGITQQIPSPQVKQENHQMFFGSDTKIDRSEVFKLDDDKLISAAFCNDYPTDKLIVTGSEKGKIAIWRDNVVEHMISLMIGQITCVGFSNDDSIIIATCKSDIFLYGTETGEFLLKLNNKVKSNIDAMHVVPYDDINGVITVQDINVTRWTWEHAHYPNKQIELKSWKFEMLMSERDMNTKFVCSTITQKFLVVGSSDNRIRMWDLEKRTVVEDFCDQSGLVICLDACVNRADNSIQILLTGFEDQTVKTWHVRPNQTASKAVKSLPMFSSYWKDDIKPTMGIRSPLISLPNTDNKIQILKGHKLIVEIDNISNIITCITFDLFGDNVFYGTDNGNVFVYKIKTKANKRIMALDKAVAYLDVMNFGGGNYIDEPLLVAASESGMLSIYHKDKCTMLIGLCDNTKIPLVPILKCYHLTSVRNKLLSIGKNRTLIKCWDIESPSDSMVLYSDNNFDNIHHTKTCISRDRSLVCITTNSNLQIFHINADENNITAVRTQGKELDDCICSCCFSNNNQYLALGCDNGNIVIWDVDKKRIYSTLSLHKSCIRNLYFSPSELILVSVGEQIAWWNLKLLPDSIRRSFRSRSNSTKLPMKPMSIDLLNNFSSLNVDMSWSKKRGPESAPHLLATIKLHGSYADYLSFSRDFESFLTVDNHGEVYIMDVLNDL